MKRNYKVRDLRWCPCPDPADAVSAAARSQTAESRETLLPLAGSPVLNCSLACIREWPCQAEDLRLRIVADAMSAEAGARMPNSQDRHGHGNIGADLTPMHRENFSLPSTPSKSVAHLDAITVAVPSLESEQQAFQPVLNPGAQSRRSMQPQFRAPLPRTRQNSLQPSVAPRQTGDPEGQASMSQELDERLQSLANEGGSATSPRSGVPAGPAMQARTSKSMMIDNAMRAANLAGHLDELPTRQNEVEVHSLGTYVFKGIAQPKRIVQILPASLSERLTMVHGQLKRGKATCLNSEQVQLSSAMVWLPDLSGLLLSRQRNSSSDGTLQQ